MTTVVDEQFVQRLRDDVAGGKRPRVQVRGGQFPAGTTGTVVRVGDPASDGDEFVVVRVKVGGVTDELGFAPGELSTTRRGRAAAVSEQPPARPARTRAKPAAQAAPVKAAPVKAAPVKAAPVKPAPVKATPVRRGSVPKVTVTITSSGSQWSVTAQRGARTVAKTVPVPPGTVAAIAGLLDEAALAQAVAEVNDTARADAQARAERLRAELAEVEAVLDSHRPPRRR